MPALLTLFIDARGRIGRQTFAISAALVVVASLVLGFLPLVGSLAMLALIWPWTVVAIKRLHDIDRSGGFAIAMGGASAVVGLLAFVTAMFAANPAVLIAMAAVVAILGALVGFAGVVLLVWLALARGTIGANRYGEPEGGPTNVVSMFSRS